MSERTDREMVLAFDELKRAMVPVHEIATTWPSMVEGSAERDAVMDLARAVDALYHLIGRVLPSDIWEAGR